MNWIGILLATWVHAAGALGVDTTGDSASVAVWDAQTKQFVAPSEQTREALGRGARVAPEAAARLVEEPVFGPAGGVRVRLKGAVARSAFVAAVESSGEVAAGCEGTTSVQGGNLALGEGSMAVDSRGKEGRR